MVKPDGVQKSLVGKIKETIEFNGLLVVKRKILTLSPEICWEHYKKPDDWLFKKGQRIREYWKSRGLTPTMDEMGYGRMILQYLVDYMTSGPCVAMLIKGEDTVSRLKKLVGETEPLNSEPRTIRKLFGDDDSYAKAEEERRAVRNIIHCSESPEAALFEARLYGLL